MSKHMRSFNRNLKNFKAKTDVNNDISHIDANNIPTKSPSFDINRDFPPLPVDKLSIQCNELVDDSIRKKIDNELMNNEKVASGDKDISLLEEDKKNDISNTDPEKIIYPPKNQSDMLYEVDNYMNGTEACNAEIKHQSNMEKSEFTEDVDSNQSNFGYDNASRNQSNKKFDFKNIHPQNFNHPLPPEQVINYGLPFPMMYQRVPPSSFSQPQPHAFFGFSQILPHQATGFIPRQTYFPLHFPMNVTNSQHFAPQMIPEQYYNQSISKDMPHQFNINDTLHPSNNLNSAYAKNDGLSVIKEEIDENNVTISGQTSCTSPDCDHRQALNRIPSVNTPSKIKEEQSSNGVPSRVDTLGFSPELQKIIQEAFGLQPDEGVFYVYVLDSQSNHRRQFRCFMHSTTPVKFEDLPCPVILNPNYGNVGERSSAVRLFSSIIKRLMIFFQGYYYVSRENVPNPNGGNVSEAVTQCRPIHSYSATIPEEYRMAYAPYHYGMSYHF